MLRRKSMTDEELRAALEASVRRGVDGLALHLAVLGFVALL